MSNKRLVSICIAMILIIPLAAAGVWWLVNYQTNFSVPNSRSDSAFIKAIGTYQSSLFTPSGQPIFTISHVDHVAKNWYVVSIVQKGNTDGITGKIVVNDPYFGAKYMNVAAGPETVFSTDELQSDQIPQSVIKDIVK